MDSLMFLVVIGTSLWVLVAELSNLNVVWMPKQILFADGSKLEEE